MQLTDNQFTPYARRQAAIAIEAHVEALKSVPPSDVIDGRLQGIFWTCNLLGINTPKDSA